MTTTTTTNTQTVNAERNEQQVEEATLSRKITVRNQQQGTANAAPCCFPMEVVRNQQQWKWEEFMAFPMEWEEYDDDSWECECGLDANAGC
jgi:hypothetical protein